jgi:hypothetical protein
MSDRKTGIVVLAVMGLLWWLIGAFTIQRPWLYGVIAAGLVACGSILARTMALPAQLQKLDRKLFIASMLFEAVAIFVCIWLLIRARAYGYIFPATAIIVGVHFIGIWKASNRRDCLWLAAALCLIGIAVLPLPVPIRNQALGLFIATALWTCAVSRMRAR